MSNSDFEESCHILFNRSDIEIVLFAKKYLSKIKSLIEQNQHKSTITLLPSKDDPYEPSEDMILNRAKVI